jgi:acetyltransferase-like isoleucine patch superfamily enzyme
MTTKGRTYIEGDWYGGGIPGNVALGDHVYLDSSYGFAAFGSERQDALVLGEACGVYDRAAVVTCRSAVIRIGPYTCLNGSYLICSRRMTIGAHCLLSWGTVLTDSWPDASSASIRTRRAVLEAASRDDLRLLEPSWPPRPVVLEDNVWVGFDAVVLPGVTLGRGCVVGCKSVVWEDVPPYAVVSGNPARILLYLDRTDSEEKRALILEEYRRA